jgi:glutamate racemase
VARFAHQIAAELVEERGVKLLVVACNTAAAAALESLRDRFDVPVIGVIEPGVRALVEATVTGRVGVIGTVGTINSGAYQRTVAAESDDDVELVALACPGFVEFVERGEFDSEQVHVLAQRLLAPARDAKVDTLLLGCTHYPYLARTLGDVMGRDVVLVSSADETAFEVRRVLFDSGLVRDRRAGGRATFVTTGDVNWFEELGRRLLGPELERAEQIRWD